MNNIYKASISCFFFFDYCKPIFKRDGRLGVRQREDRNFSTGNNTYVHDVLGLENPVFSNDLSITLV